MLQTTAAPRSVSYPYGWPCRCNLDDGFCTIHQRMMHEIHRVWNASDTPPEVRQAIYFHADGYGEPGYVPSQGYDWSGIRDSSPLAINAMWEIASGLRLPRPQ